MQYQHQLPQKTDDLPVLGAGVQRAHASCCCIAQCTMLLHYARESEKETQ
jgi:hypothetical protein